MFSRKRSTKINVERPFTTPKDNYTWLKYGQKDLAKTQLRRCYFRCAEHKREKCSAKRFVSFSIETPDDFHVKYCGSHNHGISSCQGKSCTSPGDEIPEDKNLNAENCSLQSSPVMDGSYPPISPPQNCLQSSQVRLISKRDSDVSSEFGVYWPDISWSEWDQISLEFDFDTAYWNPSNCMSLQSSKPEEPMPTFSQASFDGNPRWDHQTRNNSFSLSEPFEAFLKSRRVQSEIAHAEDLSDNAFDSRICNDVIEAEKSFGSKSELNGIPVNVKRKSLLLPFPSKKQGLRTISTPIGKFQVVSDARI